MATNFDTGVDVDGSAPVKGSGAMPCGSAMLRRNADEERKSRMQELLSRVERREMNSQGGVPTAHLLRRMDHYRELRGRCKARSGDHRLLLAWLDSIILALGEFCSDLL